MMMEEAVSEVNYSPSWDDDNIRHNCSALFQEKEKQHALDQCRNGTYASANGMRWERVS